MNILTENGSNHQQSTTGRSEKSGETIEKMPPVTSAEQKRGKPDRGLKRGMKGKQVELTESTGVKAAEIKSSDKADPINEPSAKRTTRPSRNTKEPPLAPCSSKESQSKQAVNGKTHTSAVSSGASSSSNAKDNRAQMQVKDQACQASQVEKGVDRRPKSNAQVRLHPKMKIISRKQNGGKNLSHPVVCLLCCLQVEADDCKVASSVCEPKVTQQESSSSPVQTSSEKIASDETEEKKPQADTQIPKMLPSHDSGSGEPVSTSSKRQESPQKSCSEEKRDKSKEEPHGGSHEEDTGGQLRTFVIYCDT